MIPLLHDVVAQRGRRTHHARQSHRPKLDLTRPIRLPRCESAVAIHANIHSSAAGKRSVYLSFSCDNSTVSSPPRNSTSLHEVPASSAAEPLAICAGTVIARGAHDPEQKTSSHRKSHPSLPPIYQTQSTANPREILLKNPTNHCKRSATSVTALICTHAAARPVVFRKASAPPAR
jgi:hypothetical protein